MFKRFFSVLLLVSMTLAAIFVAGCGEGSNSGGSQNSASTQSGSRDKLVIYTSMKESLIGGIIEGFKKKYPEIEVDYQSAGAGKIMAKLEAERQSGHLLADIIWTSEVPDFYEMKKQGLLEVFKPETLNEVLNPFDDYDGSFTAARLGTLGIVINTDKVGAPPAGWESILTDPTYRNSFGIADPALSGTAFMSVALLEKQFGWDYFINLKNNGAKKSKGSGRVVDDTADGNLNACLGVDYITAAKIDKGAHLKMVYPNELLMVPSPVAIFKDAPNKESAKKFVEYLLSQEAQQKVVDAGTVPVRTDVKMSDKYNLPSPVEALEKGIKINYNEVLEKKEDTVQKFSDLFK